jgi:hypothetical protein
MTHGRRTANWLAPFPASTKAFQDRLVEAVIRHQSLKIFG